MGVMQIGRVPLVGRQTDLDALRDEVDAVRTEGRAVVVSGDAGMGKTRLIRDFTETLDGVIVLRGACLDSGSGPAPLTAVTDLLRDLVDALGVDAVREAAGPGADALSVLVPAISDRLGHAERLADVVVELISQLARTHRLVLIIEDLHWADGTTLDIVTRLVRRAAAIPLFLLLSYRTDDVGRGHPLRPVLAELDRARLLTHRPLARLTPAEVAALANAVNGEPLPPAALTDIVARSDGIPFYVEELASFSGERLPVSLRDVLLLRYERLDAETQRFVRVLAVGGTEVGHEVLRAVMGDEESELEGAVRSAVDAQVIVIRDDVYAFRHALMQEAVYAELLPTERTRLHTAYAVALEAAAPNARVLADIAHHWRAAHVPERALAAAVAAQRAARRASAWSTAAEAGERALELWNAVPAPEAVCGRSRVDLLRETSASLASANRNDRALAFAREAVSLWPEDDVVGRADMLGDLASIEVQAGVSDGVGSIERALAILGDDPAHDVQRAWLLLSSARAHMLNGRHALGAEVAARAHATAEAAAAADARDVREILAQSLLIAGTCRTMSGDASGEELFHQAREYAAGFVRAMMRFHINYSNTLMVMGRYDDAMAVAREGIAYGRANVADVGPLVMVEANVIEAHIYAGRLREAEQLGGLLPMVEPGLYSAFLRERLVCLAIWRGRIEGAEAAIGIARRELDMFGAYEFQTRFGLAYDLGELALAHGDARQTLEHASLAWRTTTGGVLALPLTAVAARAIAMLRAAGEDADAGPFRAVLASMREWPVWPLWSALFAAELGEGPWSAVIDAGIGPAYFRAYARVRHGEALLAEGDRAGAREALAQAAAYADELGADGLVARARAVMSDAGLAGDAPRSALTAREEQVLELVAEGLSNAQIAERLYISAKTVSVHVSAILRKLGAPSRAAAAAIHRSSAA